MTASLNRRRLAGGTQFLSRALAPVAIVALPLILLLSSWRTFRELDEQKTVYLRNRAAIVAGRLENLSAVEESQAFELLSDEEPSLLDVELIEKPNSPADLSPIWDARELFRMQFHDNGRIFRAYVPFHSAAGRRIARIDLDAGTADFLTAHARHNVMIASLAGFALVALAAYAFWAMRRAARLEVRQLEMEHLAHMGKMAAVLAHEIRNPLGTIKGFAQLIGEKTGAGMNAFLEPILSETSRLEALVNDLLLYGRPPSPAPRRTEWRDVLIPLQADARQLIGDRPVRFVAEDPDLAWFTDPHLLHQALLNLVRNAIEAVSEPGGEVRLEVRLGTSGGLTLSVIDDGAGMAEDVQARLFEPFFTTKAFGTGLGLPITRKLIRSLGGELTLEPAEPRGTAAVVCFPCAQGETE